eukprot:UN0752
MDEESAAHFFHLLQQEFELEQLTIVEGLGTTIFRLRPWPHDDVAGVGLGQVGRGECEHCELLRQSYEQRFAGLSGVVCPAYCIAQGLMQAAPGQ